MQKKKTAIADGYPETRKRLNQLKANAGFKTLEDAINFAIDSTEEIPKLMEELLEKNIEIEKLKEEIRKLKGE